MKYNNDMRLTIIMVWVISFITIWLMFNALIPRNEFINQLNRIEQSVSKNDWKDAKESMEDLKRIYNRGRIFIQANNATEILTNFDCIMGQLDASVKYEQDAAIEYIGGLRASLDFVMKPFSGP